MKRNIVKKWFTLVELIVVVTILVILWTISFVSFQNYSVYARDSVRLSDGSNIAKMLWLQRAQGWKYIPSANFVEITANGTTILKQWIISEQLWATIWIYWELLDPLTKQPYTYTTNTSYTKYQLLQILESNELSSVVWENVLAELEGQVYNIEWNDLWIILDPQWIPIQFTWNWVDLFNTQDEYTAILNQNNSVVWTGSILKWLVWWWGLVGYWDFDELSGTGFLDRSYNHAEWVAKWWITIREWKVGNSAYFNGIDWEFVVWSIQWLWDSKWSPHSISAWLKVEDIDLDCGTNRCREWILQLWQPWGWSHHWLVWGFHGFPTQFWIWSWPQAIPQLVELEWYHVVMVFDWVNMELYTNGNVNVRNNEHSDDVISSLNIKNASLSVAKKVSNAEEFYKWWIDDLRIYNRALTHKEIREIYNLWE